MGAMDYVKKAIGSVVSPGSFNDQTAKAIKLDKKTGQAITDPANVTPLVQNETAPSQAQPSRTPDRKTEPATLERDSYRYGGGPGGNAASIGPPTDPSKDNLNSPRVTGDVEDKIASLSLYANVSNDLQKQLSKVATTGGNFIGNVVSSYSRFFLQNVTEQDQEKMQVVETFTAFYVFFYGRRPRVYNYTGLLMNDPNHKWTNDLSFFYENFFRGTKAVEINAQAVISYDGKLVSGFLINLAMQRDAMSPKGVPFSFQVIVIDDIPVSFSQDITALIANKTQYIAKVAANIKSQKELIAKNIPSKKSQVAAQARTNQKPASGVKIKTAKTKTIPKSKKA